MKLKHFLSTLEHDRIHRAIQSAEEGTSGDIVLFISHRATQDPLAAAHLEFRKLGLENAADKNSLLIFLAPKSQKFAVVGGTVLHDKVGQAGWDGLIALLARHFKENRYTDGLLATRAASSRPTFQAAPVIAAASTTLSRNSLNCIDIGQSRAIPPCSLGKFGLR